MVSLFPETDDSTLPLKPSSETAPVLPIPATIIGLSCHWVTSTYKAEPFFVKYMVVSGFTEGASSHLRVP